MGAIRNRAVGWLSIVFVASVPATARADALPDRVIVGFKSAASRQDQDRLLAHLDARVVRRLSHIRAAAVSPRGHGSLKALRRALRADRRVAYVEPDFFLDATKTPNDPEYPSQYSLAATGGGRADVPPAWDVRTSCATIAVLDSGMQYSHPDLSGNAWHNPHETKNNGKDDDKNGYVDDYYGVDLVDGSGSGADDEGHGTHVSGIVGGRGNNSTGVSGLCWSVKIVPVKFLNSRGKGATSGAIAGIDYAVKAGVKIINGSFGASEKSTALENEVSYAQGKGVLLVFAAGNDGDDIDKTPIYPASYTESNILAVAATTSSGSVASYSNYGAKGVDLAAPGDKVLSTYLDSGYKKLSGTSMASPLVAATAALLKARDSSLTYSELRSAIRGHVRKTSKLSGKVYSGGILDVSAALKSVG